ncbi:MAG: hypothetical protein JWO44_1476 [Bacteroidetes bacterium]|nr:hypothetical protein [Bacteroidota bacterium]
MSFFNYLKNNSDFFQLIGTVAGLILTVVLFYTGYRIQKLSILKEYRDPLLLFSNEALDIISDIEGLCEVEPKKYEYFFIKKNELINKLSSLRDRGKLLMPNENPKLYGADKKAAYQGIRDESLDCLKSIFHSAVAINYNYQIENKRKVNIKRLLPIKKDEKKREKTGRKKYKNITLGLRILDSLSNLPLEYRIEGPMGDDGWSVKDSIIEGKRQFTSLMFIKVNPREWYKDVRKFMKTYHEQAATIK